MSSLEDDGVPVLVPQWNQSSATPEAHELLWIRGLQHELFRPMILAWLEGEITGYLSPIEPMTHSIDKLSKIIRRARKLGLMESFLKAETVACQIHHSAQFASIQWALGRIDDTHFEARALYGLNLAFLGLLHEELRPAIQAKFKRLERKLRMSSPS